MKGRSVSEIESCRTSRVSQNVKSHKWGDEDGEPRVTVFLVGDSGAAVTEPMSLVTPHSVDVVNLRERTTPEFGWTQVRGELRISRPGRLCRESTLEEDGKVDQRRTPVKTQIQH